MYTRLVKFLDTFVVKRGSICRVGEDMVSICRPKANQSQ